MILFDELVSLIPFKIKKTVKVSMNFAAKRVSTFHPLQDEDGDESLKIKG
jgi:hypothetical protein